MPPKNPKSGRSPAATPPPAPPDSIRIGLDPATLERAIQDHLVYSQGRFEQVATRHDHYMALAYAVRDRLLERWVHTAETYLKCRSRTVCYLSAEFLMGPQLGNNLVNLGIHEPVATALSRMGLPLEDLLEEEAEPGLGNGGLGRLAACFLDSLATLEIPSMGYGIRYEFGIFDQAIRDGWQVERTDKWLRLGNPWEIPRPEITFDVPLGGRTESFTDDQGRQRVRWIPDRVVRGTAYDTPVVGYRVHTVNLLRLWKAEAAESFDFQAFNSGDYYGAVMQKMVSENITKVLYPNDDSPQGKALRLQQQFFFASCALQDMLRIHGQCGTDLGDFADKFAVQLNDTHPTIAIAELMRLLVDVHGMAWDAAWDITVRTFGYTNHTLLPEALERWSVDLFGATLPRHLEILYEINRRFLDGVRARFPGDDDRVRRLSLVDESVGRFVRMAHLACVGSHSINGVARLHSELLKTGVLRDFFELFPEKFSNKTNGVTPRRFVLLSNPRLSSLITGRIGDSWIRDGGALRRLEALADDPAFQAEWMAVKRAAKEALAVQVQRELGLVLNPDSLFDVQVKRIHEYKRQHLNILHIVTLYNRLRRNPDLPVPPRTFVFGGKAAPGYFMAKRMIRLITAVAGVVNTDPALGNRLRVVFLPNFNVKKGQRVYPAADVSEQISTAGMEASGTGNMKFTMNGALTVGTLDGANVEIRDAVGTDNFFLFGLTVPEIGELRARGYHPRTACEEHAELREALDQIRSGFFSPEDPDVFHPLVDGLLQHDPYLLLADYASYVACQERVGLAYRDARSWVRMSILNVARSGQFSSDRTIREYCRDIWKIAPVPITLPT